MKTLEEKKKEKLPKYIRAEEFEKYLQSNELNQIVLKLKEREEYREKTKDVSVGEYWKKDLSQAGLYKRSMR